jgi:hypothetical protein
MVPLKDTAPAALVNLPTPAARKVAVSPYCVITTPWLGHSP